MSQNIIRIKPAVLAADPEEFAAQIYACEDFCSEIDIDIINWTRNAGKTISAEQALMCKTTGTNFSFDLMMDHPAEVFDLLAEDSRVNTVLYNLRSKDNVLKLVHKTQDADMLAGISVNPESTLTDLEKYLAWVDIVQIMTIEPGAQGNPFLKERLQLVTELRSTGFTGLIGLDGGINLETIEIVKNYKIDFVSVGSAISRASSPSLMYHKLVTAVS